MLPNFIIIGAPRAGTTWIAKNLRLHPDIYMPKIKELHFFDVNYGKGITYYERFYKCWKTEKMGGEATPAYLYVRHVPELIHKHLPDIKMIVSLRNPVERLYSRYWNAKAKYTKNKNLSFEEKIKLKPVFIEEGFYYDHLTRYYNFFSKENILILLYDDLKKDPNQFLMTIYDFLGVDSAFTSPLLTESINAASDKKGLVKSDLLWYLHKGFEKIKIHTLSDTIKKFNNKHLPCMEKETREWLIKDVYLQKNKLLEDLIGRDLSSWNEVQTKTTQ